MEDEGGEGLTNIRFSEKSFMKAALVLQLTRGEEMTLAQLREETKIENIQSIVNFLVEHNYLEMRGAGNFSKYRANIEFRRI